MDNLAATIAELTARIERLERMVGAKALPPQSDIRREIAMVRASGGDLIAHFKAKAKRQMRRSREN
jgi:hypothetical protein